MLSALLALITAAVFTGAALYINVAEQPARLLLDDGPLLAEWKPAYKRGFAMQASLAILGCLLGLVAFWQFNHPGFIAGAILMIANWPWTLFVMMPTNLKLMAATDGSPETRALIVTWGGYHAVRTTLGSLATVAFLWALTAH